MFVPFLIMLREGLEITLIISFIASYLKKTNKKELFLSMWQGIISAVFLCFAIVIVIDKTTGEFPQKQQELFESIVSIFTVIIMTYMVFWMKQTSINIKLKLKQNIDKIFTENSINNKWSIKIIVFLSVLREGLESIFFLLSSFQQDVGIFAPVGAILGLTLAIIIGLLFYFFSKNINLSSFFKWSSFLILFIAAGIASGVIRSLHEAGLWNFLQEVVFDLSNNSILSSNTLLGTLLSSILGLTESPTIGEVIVYFAYLLPMLFMFFKLYYSVKSRPKKIHSKLR